MNMPMCEASEVQEMAAEYEEQLAERDAEIERLNGENSRLRRLSPALTGYANGYADALDDAPEPVFTDEDAKIIVGMQRSIIERLKKEKGALRHMLHECAIQMDIHEPKKSMAFRTIKRNALAVWAKTSDEPMSKAPDTRTEQDK